MRLFPGLVGAVPLFLVLGMGAVIVGLGLSFPGCGLPRRLFPGWGLSLLRCSVVRAFVTGASRGLPLPGWLAVLFERVDRKSYPFKQ